MFVSSTICQQEVSQHLAVCFMLPSVSAEKPLPDSLKITSSNTSEIIRANQRLCSLSIRR